MSKRIVATFFSLVIASAALKTVTQLIYSGSSTPRHADILTSEQESQAFVFSGIEVALPWSRITGVFASRGSIIFGVEDKKKFSIMRIPTSPLPAVTRQRMRDRIEMFFLGDIAQLIIHPERIDRIYIAKPNNVTWWSNPFSDVRTIIGLIVWRSLGGVPPKEQVENSFMRGYHTHFRQEVKPIPNVDVYDLGMKDGTSRVNIMMFEGTGEFADPLLESIRVVRVMPEFSRQAFERSKTLARMGAGDSNMQKLALLTAIEAVSNTSPKLEYYSHVLDLYRKSHLSRLAPAWFGSAIHEFPASRSTLVARHPEFAQYK